MNQLVYKMEGFDKEWYNVGRNSVINYSNLPYGTYIFHLRGSNSDGKWNEKERILKIHILPPFYLSGWAYFIYLLLGILSVVGIIYYLGKGMSRNTNRSWRNSNGKRNANSILQK